MSHGHLRGNADLQSQSQDLSAVSSQWIGGRRLEQPQESGPPQMRTSIETPFLGLFGEYLLSTDRVPDTLLASRSRVE